MLGMPVVHKYVAFAATMVDKEVLNHCAHAMFASNKTVLLQPEMLMHSRVDCAGTSAAHVI